MDQLTAQKGIFTYPLTMVLPGALNSVLQSSIQLLQGIDFKIVSIQSIQTGNWSIIWGTNTINFMPTWVRFQNILGTGILPHRWVGPGYDYCPVFPRGSSILIQARNDTANPNTIDLAIEGIYGDFGYQSQ